MISLASKLTKCSVAHLPLPPTRPLMRGGGFHVRLALGLFLFHPYAYAREMDHGPEIPR